MRLLSRTPRVAVSNWYLVDAPNVYVESRSKPLCDVPPMNFGNMPRDGGNLIIEADEYEDFLRDEPQAAPFIRPLLGADEFLKGLKRYCIWLVDADLAKLRNCPKILDRVEKCRQMRLASKAAATRKFAATPGLFCQITQPEGKDYILVPCVSSEKREYVPIGFITAGTVVTNLVQIIPDATLYHFGILTSRMHNAWMRAVGGRLESRYRYSKDIVYNNFVWPECGEAASCRFDKAAGSRFTTEIAAAAQAVLDARAAHPTATLADLYDPRMMPPDLVKVHAHLDALVDRAYGLSPSCTDSGRVAHLFRMYAEKATSRTAIPKSRSPASSSVQKEGEMKHHTDWFAANAAHISANAVRREPIRVINKKGNQSSDLHDLRMRPIAPH